MSRHLSFGALLPGLLIACMPAAGASGDIVGGGTLKASAAIGIRIVIPRIRELDVLDQPAVVTVDEAAAARGELVVTGMRVALVANDRRGYVVRGRLDGPFAQAVVDGLDAPLEVTSAGGRALMPSMVGKRRPAPFAVRYRFRLEKGTAPGVYAWPVSLSIEAP